VKDWLAPCPFCGKTDIEMDDLGEDVDDGSPVWMGCCAHCGAIGPASNVGRSEARELWNSRVSPPLARGARVFDA